MPVLWKDDYSVGVDEIDKQHKNLFDSINKLEELVQKGISEGPEVDRLLRFLGTYVQTHFTFEENCMRQHKCPVAGKNKEAHEKFLKFYSDFVVELKKTDDKEGMLLKLYAFAESWLVGHICKIDKHLRACVGQAQKA